MSLAKEKNGECVVCCHRCGGFLMESVSTTSYMVCPEYKMSRPNVQKILYKNVQLVCLF